MVHRGEHDMCPLIQGEKHETNEWAGGQIERPPRFLRYPLSHLRLTAGGRDHGEIDAHKV